MEKWWEEDVAVQEGQWWQEDSNAAKTLQMTPPEEAAENSKDYDTAIKTGQSIENVQSVRYGFYGTQVGFPQSEEATGLSARFGKQLYNNLIANTVHELGKSDFSAAEHRTHKLMQQWEKENNIRMTDEWYRATYGEWLKQLTEPPETREEDYLKGEPQYDVPVDKNPFAATVTEAETVPEKLIDTVTGITGFIIHIALLKKLAPSMPEPVVWETINLANGGKPGAGAAMQTTLASIGKFIPGGGILPAVERGTAASTLFGISTYIGGGDTTDILINMGIPFAFEGMGLTKQSWANYKNKQPLINFWKQKAPALKSRTNVEIDKAVSDLLTNIAEVGIEKMRTKEQMAKEFAPKEKPKDLSVEAKDWLQRKYYDELVERANAGEKKAIKQLNDYVQGTNLPTYDELLERVYQGDMSAVEQIQLENYRGGKYPKAELNIPSRRAKQDYARIESERRPTDIERIRSQTEVVINDQRKPEKIDPKDLSKAKERGFITSVKEVVPELKIDNQYIPRPTDPLAIKAKNLIYDNLAKAEQIAMKPTNDAGIAITAEVIKYYNNLVNTAPNPTIKNVYLDKIANIANSSSYNLTEGGRFIQAASILARLTPEGQVRFAAKEIQAYNRRIEKGLKGKARSLFGLQKKIPELTKEQAEYILKEMGEISNMPDGKAKAMRFNKLQTHISELVPTPMFRKIITVWKAGLLTGIKTHGLNLSANVFHLGTEAAKDIPAAAVDKVVSYFTGQRTVAPTVKGIKGGGIEGYKKGLEYIKTGYSERDIGAKIDYKKVNFGKGNTGRALNAYTQTIFRLMGAGDQPFYYAAKLRSLYEQAKVAAINNGLKGKQAQEFINNLMQNPTEQMVKNATMDAETAVFINQTKLGEAARGIQKLPGGEVVVPFSRTPSAVAMQIVNYSPVGAVKTIIENIGKGRFDQRTFSQGIGRSITGTAVLVIGAALYKHDMVTLDRPTNERERKLWELEGRQANAVKIGGKWRTIQSFGPAGNLLVIGGHFQRAFEESGSPTEAMSTAIIGSGKSFTEQTFMRGVNQFVDALSDPERSAAYVAGNTISSIIPVIVGDIARTTDIKERRAETLPQRFLVKTPLLRRTLEPQITVLGEERKPTANPIELMIDPTRPSKEISTPVIKELRRLWDEGWEVSPTQLGLKKGYEVLNQQENTQLWERAGNLTKQGLEMFISEPVYAELPDADKADAISKLVIGAQSVARAEMVVQKLQGLKGEELQKMLFELRKTGLATEDIIPIALSKQKEEAVRRKKARQ